MRPRLHDAITDKPKLCMCTGVLLALVAENAQAEESFWDTLLTSYSEPENYLIFAIIVIFGYVVSRLFSRNKK